MALRRTSLGLSTAALVLLTAAALASLAGRPPAEDSTPTGADLATATAGLRVVMDPASGRIVGRPTADQLTRRPGAPGLGERRDWRDLERFDLAFGARGVALDDWADHSLRLERAADGSLEVVCAQGDSHGEAR